MKSRIIVLVGIFAFLSLAIANSVSAKTDENAGMDEEQKRYSEYANTGIKFYDGCLSSGNSYGNISVCSADLPEETVERLENEGVREKAEENYERYKYAEDQTGVPWQVLATLHYMEAGMGSNQSISNGEELYDHVNVDGIHVSSNANEDAKQAAEHFIEMAKYVYDVNVLEDKSVDAYGKAFLAYNRGGMYQCNGNVPYTESPYVMNFYDEDHKNMTFSHADAFLCDGSRINDTDGYTWSHIGALATLAYLCGVEVGSSSISSSSSGLSSDSSSGSGVGSNNITLIGDSIAKYSEAELKEKFPDGFFTMVGAREPTRGATEVCSGDVGGLATVERLAAGMETVQTQHADGSCETLSAGGDALKDNVVWEMGTNTNGATRDTIESVIDLIGKNRNLYLVTTYREDREKEKVDEIAEMYREVAKDYDNVYIVEWAGAVKDNVSEYIFDGVHPNEEGRKLLASLIYEAVVGAGNCYEGDYPVYLQCDERWGGLSYGSGTFCNSACGAVAMATIATIASGKEVLPTDVKDVLGSLYYPDNPGTAMETLNKKVCEKYGCEVDMVPYTPRESGLVDKIRQSLKDGWMILTSGECSVGDHSSTCPYSSGGHYVAILGLKDNDTAIVSDPGWDGITEYKLSELADGLRASAYSIIRGNGKCDNNGDMCKDSKKTTGTSGFSATKDAQFIVEDYLADDLSGYTLLTPGSGDRHDNCVAFSCWFITNYTEISYPGGRNASGYTGDGAQFVDVFYESMGSDYPDLEISNEPSVYSVASWGVPTMGTGSGNHTGIVIGINEAEGKIMIAEAGWDSPSFLGIHEYDLSEAVGNSAFKYINLNKYLKSNTGLK